MAYVSDDYHAIAPIRLYSSVNQISEVAEAIDDEDIARIRLGAE